MSIVRFIGCTHFGHGNMALARGFNDANEHDWHLINSWNSVVTNKKDLTIITGDVTMETSKFYTLLDFLNGRKKVVLGNHDRPKDVPQLLNHVDEVMGAYRYKGYLVTHVPIHPNDIYLCRGNIHSHIHENKLHEVEIKHKYDDEDSVVKPTLHRYFNVDAEQLDYKPATLKELTGR